MKGGKVMGTYDTVGGTPRHNPEFDRDLACEVCGRDPAQCICPICPVCGQQGNPNCFTTPGRCQEDDFQRVD